jgi:hypothetical protein
MIGMLVAQCGKTSDQLTCTGDCAFVIENGTGTMIKMECFDRFAIKTKHPDVDSLVVYGIADELDSAYNVEGKTVTFSGIFRPNTLTPIFPDPGFDMNSLFQMEVTSIK